MANPGERITNVRCTDDELGGVAGRRTLDIGAPGLVSALAACHWPSLDEDLSVAGLLRGAPAPRQALPLA